MGIKQSSPFQGSMLALLSLVPFFAVFIVLDSYVSWYDVSPECPEYPELGRLMAASLVLFIIFLVVFAIITIIIGIITLVSSKNFANDKAYGVTLCMVILSFFLTGAIGIFLMIGVIVITAYDMNKVKKEIREIELGNIKKSIEPTAP